MKMKIIFIIGERIFLIPQKKIFILIVFLLLLSACSAGQPQTRSDSQIKVVATTSIVGDVVQQIGGDLVDVSVLLPPGSDPHSFQPAPKDAAQIADADLIFANGAGLEEFLAPLLESAGGQAPVIEVSDGVTLLEATAHENESQNDGEHPSGDPHTWFDPQNVMIWVDNISQALQAADPQNRQVYADNAQAYRQQLQELDRWISEQVQSVPLEKRKLVTDHTSLTYFAERYGFEQVGSIIPAYSTLAETSAQELAQLEENILSQAIQAIFVSESVNPALAQRVAQDTGVRLVSLNLSSLSQPDGEGSNDPQSASYLEYMRKNVTSIVEALR
jgi:ABC-type Zn uptake system ZnuABC Zn-binding protein ZnuA